MKTLRAPWREDASIQTLEAAFAEAKTPLYYVGGCVRDALMQCPIGDVDAATPALPEAVQALLSGAGIRSIPTGIAHGTITVLLPEADGLRTVEITTFRSDEICDGRHAQVTFGSDMKTDAARRDFTMNALYLDMQNHLHDPLGQGVADAETRHLRFIGQPTRRIEEDALRILRFYRFTAQLELPKMDAEARAACAAEAARLEKLSGERIQQEMKKLLTAAAPTPVLQAMRQDGISEYVIPEMTNPAFLLHVTKAERALGLSAQIWARLARLISTPLQARRIARRWRLSKADAAQLLWLTEARLSGIVPNEALLKQIARVHGKEDAFAWLTTLADAPPEIWGENLRAWKIPQMPLNGTDLLALGFEGKPLGTAFAALETLWETSHYTLDREVLLQHARELRNE